MKKKLLALAVALMALMQPLSATPPVRKAIRVTQSDGTAVWVYKKGNGHFGFYATKDGLALTRNANRDLCYAALTADGDLRPTDRLAHDADARSAEEQAFVRENGLRATTAFASLSARRMRNLPARATRATSTDDGLGTYGQRSAGVVNSIGKPLIPLIMVQFADCKFMEETTMEKVGRSRNEPGYRDEWGCVGSCKDYFEAQSNGLFSPTFDVAALVTLSKGYAYYGQNRGTSLDANVRVMIKEAIELAAAQGVDFGKYAIDGEIPLVSILYAGPGEHASEDADYENYLWPHFSEPLNIKVGGINVASYFVGNEVMQEYDNNGKEKSRRFDGIGVFVHEFGHALGLPDFYDTEYKDDMETPDLWSVMDYGGYWKNSYAPIGYNAYERAFMGWLEVEDLGDEPRACELYPFGSDKGATAYRIVNPANPKEYYLLENRQVSTWYPTEMGHGMLITHVDYDENAWYYNCVNDAEGHLRFTAVPADGTWQVYDYTSQSLSGFKGDLFPGTRKNTSFTDDTTPAATVFTGGKLGRPIYRITENSGVITFSYLDENVTGIAAVETAPQTADVYGTDGRLVGRSLPLSALKERLAPGIYVVKTAAGTYKRQIK